MQSQIRPRFDERYERPEMVERLPPNPNKAQKSKRPPVNLRPPGVEGGKGPGREARPIAREDLVHPGFFSIDQISTQTHQSIASVETGFSRRVTEGAFNYYTACLAYARMLKVLKRSGRPVSSSEESFMDMIYSGNYQTPLVWQTVYACRLQADITYTSQPDVDPHCNLPNDIRPAEENAGFPTSNLLGYAPSRELTPHQIQWFHEAGFTDNGNSRVVFCEEDEDEEEYENLKNRNEHPF
ncbi:hypothetical protein WN48_11185 [Eufriesea mexicana]|uniref:Uncharacterized protein n=1 Tax=Eufriesea mexicana TaxID=516756 RepID=A0A310SFD7_9HYME|nr:hypothetical protein WN48_11185 [Eufriesea mexicana]